MWGISQANFLAQGYVIKKHNSMQKPNFSSSSTPLKLREADFVSV